MARLIDLDALIEALTAYQWRDENDSLIDDADEKKEFIKGWLPNLPIVEKPKRESKALLPCKCGCKRREHWYGGTKEYSEGLKCMKCGFTVWGKDGMDVIRKWNEAVRE